MSQTAQQPKYRIFKTYLLAEQSAYNASLGSKVKYVVTCIHQQAYLVAPKDFNPLESGFDYPAYK